jgi:hypothetical protein
MMKKGIILRFSGITGIMASGKLVFMVVKI